MHMCIDKGLRTDCGWPQWPSAASAPGRSMFHARLGVANIEPEAAGGAAPNVAGMGVYPAVACFAPICHKYISPVALPASRYLESVLVCLDQRLARFTKKEYQANIGNSSGICSPNFQENDCTSA
jgi:hypothetical protein